MRVKSFKKIYDDVELDPSEVKRVYNSHPATNLDLINRLVAQFTKAAIDFGVNPQYDSVTKSFTVESCESWVNEFYRDATPTEIDFYDTVATLRNILLSQSISTQNDS